MKINDIENPKHKAIVLMFGKDVYDELASIELEDGEKIFAWFFYDDDIKSREELIQLYSMDSIEVMYCRAYNGASSF
ncbi:MAG TPA: hypothetical protein EYG73_00225 [Arcobacter sp.]|nr:hypothetical protein [Arcobacter sp.]